MTQKFDNEQTQYHDGLWVRAADYDAIAKVADTARGTIATLNTKLIAAQQEAARHKMANEADGKIVIDMAGAMEKMRPEMIEAMLPMLTNPMLAAMEAQLQEQKAARAAEVEGLEQIIGAQNAIITALTRALSGAEHDQIDFEQMCRDYISETQDPGKVRMRTMRADAVTARRANTVTALRLAREVMKPLMEDHPDPKSPIFYACRDSQLGTWTVQQEPITVVRSYDDEVLTLVRIGEGA